MPRHLVVPALVFLLLSASPPAAQTITRTDPGVPMAPELAIAREQFFAGDYTAALPVIQAAAMAGDVTAQNLLGVAYSRGRGVPQDPVQSVAWLTRAAEQGDPRAMVNLASVYRDGDGAVPADPVAARAWMEQAADQGFQMAYAHLGRMIELGVGGPVDLDRARVLYEQADALGDADGTTYLAFLYREGHGVAQDLTRARALFQTAAEAGVAEAQSALGRMHETGQGGMAADLDAAQRLYRAALDQGHYPAAFFLARLIHTFAPAGTTPAEAAALCAQALVAADDTRRDRWAEDCATISAAAGRK